MAGGIRDGGGGQGMSWVARAVDCAEACALITLFAAFDPAIFVVTGNGFVQRQSHSVYPHTLRHTAYNVIFVLIYELLW